MSKTLIHADDYGISPYNSQKYIDLLQRGCLDSISILPNTQHFDQCASMFMEKLDTFPRKPLYSVHLNLVDGLSVSTGQLSLLHDDNKCITTSWGKLFLASFIPSSKRKLLKEQLKEEIYAQIVKVHTTYNYQSALRIDSHMHTHMIPLVSEAIYEVITENNLSVEFIRMTCEPLHLFLHNLKYATTYSPINLIKNVILNLLAPQLDRKLKKLSLSSSYLLGVMMSGHMDQTRVTAISPIFSHYALKQNRDLEILFHPGQMSPDELGIAQNKKDIYEFYLSDNRNIEYDCICAMR